MSRSVLATTSARRTAALLTTATATLGLLTVASPAHADSVVQIAGPAGPLPTNTAYTVTVNVPNNNPNFRLNSSDIEFALTGAAATVTSARTSQSGWTCNFAAGSSGTCWHLAGFTTPVSITLTVMPTAGGTVTTDVKAMDFSGAKQVGGDTLNTRIASPAPAVTGLAPDHGPLAGGTKVTLTGTNLTGTTAVAFGTTPATEFTVDSDTQITATAPAGSAAGPVDVTVTTPGGTGAAGKYTYDTPAPAVTGLAPDHGPLAGGTKVTLTGTHLNGATAVNFGTTPATAFTVDSDTQITATTPAGSAAGPVDVTVTTPGGTGAAGKYTYEEGSYVFSQTSDPTSGSTVKTGDKVTYTVTVAQRGTGEVRGATVTGDLSKVLDDAAYNGDVKATSGTAEVKDGKLTWTGDLPQGGTATITYSVTVNGNGDKQLHSAVTTTDGKRGTCAAEKDCGTDHTATAASTPTPTPTPTPTDAQTPDPAPSTTTPGTPESSSAPTTPRTSSDTQTPPAARASGGLLASTGSTTLTTATISGALLILGGLTVALSRRRRRHG
ncbi:IPT/TIG domain-containing protein [Kitasatospora sp. NPDC048286]|uniref:IPT/TIG domain-containing protein n=1 Tax=Kitasatospora sp. NPDC048286 TaxID=3364047 RepID=UPI0037135C6F